jgi:hypothetical protein
MPVKTCDKYMNVIYDMHSQIFGSCAISLFSCENYFQWNIYVDIHIFPAGYSNEAVLSGTSKQGWLQDNFCDKDWLAPITRDSWSKFLARRTHAS